MDRAPTDGPPRTPVAVQILVRDTLLLYKLILIPNTSKLTKCSTYQTPSKTQTQKSKWIEMMKLKKKIKEKMKRERRDEERRERSRVCNRVREGSQRCQKRGEM